MHAHPTLHTRVSCYFMLAAWAGNPQLTNFVGTRQNYNTKAVVTKLRPKITWLTRFTLTVADCSKVVETTMSQVKDHKADQETMQCNDKLCNDCAFRFSRHALDATSSQLLKFMVLRLCRQC